MGASLAGGLRRCNSRKARVVGGFDIPCHSEQSEESSAIRELPPSGFLVSLGMTDKETE
jgi:hypothetical protein